MTRNKFFTQVFLLNLVLITNTVFAEQWTEIDTIENYVIVNGNAHIYLNNTQCESQSDFYTVTPGSAPLSNLMPYIQEAHNNGYDANLYYLVNGTDCIVSLVKIYEIN